jgi:hypothetical protein
VTEVRAIIKNTFLEFVEGEAPATAGGGRCRASSCPCVRVHDIPIDDGAYSEDDSSTCPRLSSLGSWADVSETEEEDGVGCCASADLKPWSRSDALAHQARLAPGAEEKTPAGTGAVLAQVPGSSRTPLSSKASAFVPTPLSSKASAFVPGSGARKQAECSPEQVSAPGTAQVPSVLQKETTVLMRNLPPDLSRGMLIKAMHKKGFAGLFDIVHLPLEVPSKKCMGYAYVSLTTMEHKQRFTDAFHGFKGWPVSSPKCCSIAWSQTKGAPTNTEGSRNSPETGNAVPDSFKKMAPFLGSTKEWPKGRRRR